MARGGGAEVRSRKAGLLASWLSRTLSFGPAGVRAQGQLSGWFWLAGSCGAASRASGSLPWAARDSVLLPGSQALEKMLSVPYVEAGHSEAI